MPWTKREVQYAWLASRREKILDNTSPEPNSGCWLWTAGLNEHGYGELKAPPGYSRKAHRHAYEVWRGPIPEGLDLDHLCRVRSCVNPWHLEPVTRSVNLRRGTGIAGENARKTHCKRGHEFTPENTGIHGDSGCRYCKECKRSYWGRP